MNLEHNKSLISDLICLAKADDVVDTAEYDFIHRIGARMGLDFDVVEDLFENPQSSVQLFSEMDRIIHFHKLLMVMNVDRETHEKEIIALRNFGLKLGIHPGAIDQILLKMNQYEDKIIPSDDLIAIFHSYYN